MKGKFLFASTIVAYTLFAFLVSPAQAASPSSIITTITPQNPAPAENTSISLSSYSNNLDSVSISWSVNGKNITSGIGKKTFSVIAPASGGQTEVVATVALPEGTIEKKIIIRPSVMALLWQALDSYTPPFYKGKALPTPGSEVKVVAMPEIKTGGVLINPNNMVYSWKKDYSNDVTNSGYGKNSFTYTNDYLDNSNNIGVVASTVDQKYSSETNLNIYTYTPKILFYKNDDALGTLWQNALADGHHIVGSELIEAAPYYISPADLRIPFLVFHWIINNQEIAVPDLKKNFMPLQVQPGLAGSSTIRLELENTYKIFESAAGEISVKF